MSGTYLCGPGPGWARPVGWSGDRQEGHELVAVEDQRLEPAQLVGGAEDDVVVAVAPGDTDLEVPAALGDHQVALLQKPGDDAVAEGQEVLGGGDRGGHGALPGVWGRSARLHLVSLTPPAMRKGRRKKSCGAGPPGAVSPRRPAHPAPRT